MTTKRTRGNDDHAPLTVRLRERSGSERIGNRPERFVLECGLDGKTTEIHQDGSHTTREKGRMVACYFTDPRHLPDALRTVADMWERKQRTESGVTGRIIVPQFN